MMYKDLSGSRIFLYTYLFIFVHVFQDTLFHPPAKDYCGKDWQPK